ncbi:hypothetical protein [Fibrella aquatica]
MRTYQRAVDTPQPGELRTYGTLVFFVAPRYLPTLRCCAPNGAKSFA